MFYSAVVFLEWMSRSCALVFLFALALFCSTSSFYSAYGKNNKGANEFKDFEMSQEQLGAGGKPPTRFSAGETR